MDKHEEAKQDMNGKQDKIAFFSFLFFSLSRDQEKNGILSGKEAIHHPYPSLSCPG